MRVIPEVAQAAYLNLKCESLEKDVARLGNANQLLRAELEALRESNAWFRARNMELLRMLSGRKDHPGDRDPHRLEPTQNPENSIPPPPAAFVRSGHAHL